MFPALEPEKVEVMKTVFKEADKEDACVVSQNVVN